MFKKMIVSVLTAGMAAGLALSAGAAEPTVDEILEKSYEIGQTLTEFNAVAVMDVDVSLAESSLGDRYMKANAEMDMSCIIEPFLSSIEVSFDADVDGKAAEGDMTEYIAMDDETGMHVYVAGEVDGEQQDWQHIVSKEMNLNDMLDTSKTIDYKTLPMTYTLAEEHVMVDDIECYELQTAITWDTFMELMNKAIELMGEDSEAAKVIPTDQLAFIGMFAQGIHVNVLYDIDTETYAPMRVTLNLDGSDLSQLELLLGTKNKEGSIDKANVTVDACSLVIDYYYGDPVEVDIPEEALNTPAQDLEEMMKQAEEMANGYEAVSEAADEAA